jgi:hypothetical protein
LKLKSFVLLSDWTSFWAIVSPNNLGSMLWSQFSLIYASFRRKKIGVFLKNQCYDQVFANTSSSLSKKRQIFLLNFSAKIFKKS